MAKQTGRKAILKVETAANTFTVVAGSQTVSVVDNVEEINATTPGAANPGNPPEYDAFAGTRKVTISGTFSVVDDAAEAHLLNIADGATRKENFQVDLFGGGDAAQSGRLEQYEGEGLLTELRLEGTLEGMQQYTVSIVLTGAVTFTKKA